MKRIYLNTLCGTVIATLALMGTAWAASEPAPAQKQPAPGTAMTEKGKLDRHDQNFLKEAAQINLTEIQLGKVAERVSTDPNVKKIAAMIVKDHTEANRNLERLAASKGVTLPIALYEKESARTQDPDIKAWAQKMVPSLKEHLAMSQGSKTEAIGEKKKWGMKHHQMKSNQ